MAEKDWELDPHQRFQKAAGTPIPIDIKFGDVNVASPCNNCNRLSTSGEFIVIRQQNAIFICIRCLATMVVRWQETHPGEKLFETDVDVDESAYQKAADAAREKAPELSESEAMEVAKAVIEVL